MVSFRFGCVALFLIASLFTLPSSFLSFPPREAKAAEFRLVPSLGIQEEYNDNIFYSDRERVDDFITTITPGLELVNRTEKVDLNLLARLNILRYAETTELNNIDQNYLGKIRYSPTTKWTLSGEAGYLKDSRPDRDLEVTGLVNSAAIRDRQNYGAGLEHTLTEKTRGSLSYAFEEDKYDNPRFADLRAHNAILGFTHDLSKYLPNITGRMNFGYSRYEYDFGTIDYSYATIGMKWALSEKWDLLLDGGGSYTVSELGPDGNRQRDTGAGWFGMGSISYKGEKTTGDLTFSHRILPAYGSVGVTNRTSVTFGIDRRFTYEFSGGLSGGYFLNKADQGEFSTVAFDEETYFINPRLRYEFTRDIFLEGSYNFSITKFDITRTEARRNLVMLRLYVQHALFE